jgi:hypothetical protein
MSVLNIALLLSQTQQYSFKVCSFSRKWLAI